MLFCMHKALADNHNYFGACAECTDWIYHQQYSKEKYVTVYPLVREDKG